MISMHHRTDFCITFAVVASFALAACHSSDAEIATERANDVVPKDAAMRCPIAGAESVDNLIQKGEKHFAHLWKVTQNVENAAEGYWSESGDRLTMQAMPDGTACDRIFVTDNARSSADRTALTQISNGMGVTTCSYFVRNDTQLLYASTHAFMTDCPQRPDMSHGYVWAVHPEYDIYVHDLGTGKEKALTTEWGYDAEATVSPLGDRMVFTSSRSGDLELWTCDLDGKHPTQVTNEIGYDGGAYYSHDGKWLVFRSSAWTPGKETAEQAEYTELFKRWLVRPTHMEIMMCRPDGSERRRVTNLGEANFAPYFFPGDKRIIFASNSHDKALQGRNFDLFAVDVDGKNVEQITNYEQFDSFPMFSPDGHWLAFASNRGGRKPHETNMFVAQWKD